MCVAKLVKISRLNKMVATLAMLLFFTFGAVSLAHDVAPARPFATLDLRGWLKQGPVQFDGRDFALAVQFETGQVPRCSASDLAAPGAIDGKPVKPLARRIPAQAHAAKLSLQIHDSVLLL